MSRPLYKVGDYLTLDESFFDFGFQDYRQVMIPLWIIEILEVQREAYVYSIVGMEDEVPSEEAYSIVELFYRRLKNEEAELIKILYG
jgi:hypothetical protein